MRAMTDFENQYIKGKSLEELIDGLTDPNSGLATSYPGSPVHEITKLAIQAKLERLAAPKRWAAASFGAAVVSDLAAVASAVAAF
jgi:hypothetical protein